MTRLVRRAYIGHSFIVRDKVYKAYVKEHRKTKPEYRFYQCKNEFCAEIKEKRCNRTCHDKTFKTGDGRTVIFSKEDIIVAKCFNETFENTVMKCTEYEVSESLTDIQAKDCISGKYTSEVVKMQDFNSLKGLVDDNTLGNVTEIAQYQNLVIHSNVR